MPFGIFNKATGQQYKPNSRGATKYEYTTEYAAAQALAATPPDWRSAYEVREMKVDGPKDTPEELMKHADEWEALAEEQDTKDGQAARNRAFNYRRAAQALRLEARTGTPHCACCLKPTAETGCHRPKRPTR